MTWISVKERLPRKLQKVLFHWSLHGSSRNISMGYLCNEGWDIYLPYSSFKLRADVCLVTHWMELPEFPDCPEEELSDFRKKCTNILFIEREMDEDHKED